MGNQVFLQDLEIIWECLGSMDKACLDLVGLDLEALVLASQDMVIWDSECLTHNKWVVIQEWANQTQVLECLIHILACQLLEA